MYWFDRNTLTLSLTTEAVGDAVTVEVSGRARSDPWNFFELEGTHEMDDKRENIIISFTFVMKVSQ